MAPCATLGRRPLPPGFSQGATSHGISQPLSVQQHSTAVPMGFVAAGASHTISPRHHPRQNSPAEPKRHVMAYTPPPRYQATEALRTMAFARPAPLLAEWGYAPEASAQARAPQGCPRAVPAGYTTASTSSTRTPQRLDAAENAQPYAAPVEPPAPRGRQARAATARDPQPSWFLWAKRRVRLGLNYVYQGCQAALGLLLAVLLWRPWAPRRA